MENLVDMLKEDKEILLEAGGAPEAVLCSETMAEKLKEQFVERKVRNTSGLHGTLIEMHGMKVFTISDRAALVNHMEHDAIVGTIKDIVTMKQSMERVEGKVFRDIQTVENKKPDMK